MRRTKKRLSIFLLVAFLVQLLPVSGFEANAASVAVRLTSDHMPGYIFCQAPDSGKWIGEDSRLGRIEVEDDGGEPKVTYVETTVEIFPPEDKPWEDEQGNKYTIDQVHNIRATNPVPTKYPDERTARIEGSNMLVVAGYAGKGYEQFRDINRCGTNNFANYRFDVRVEWVGEVFLPDPPAPNPGQYTITGDFDILPSSTINYRESFTLRPKNFVIPNACTYQYHEYRIQKDGVSWTSSRVTSQSADSSYSYATYPPNVGVGSNFIQIKITANCGAAGTVDSGWTAGKYLTINTSPTNQPPQFSVGFFKEYNRTGWTPDTEVVIGTRVNLRVIHDPTKNPPWPYDPDGDPVTYTWLFESGSSDWIRSLPNEYGLDRNAEAHYNLVATQEGYHSVTVIARDPFGGESRKTAYINVIPENPIPVIDGPTEVKENRPLPKPFDGSRSYSPIGRAIVEYQWENKKDRYETPGKEIIKLHVVDSGGLKSLAPAVHTLTVLPDEPPVAVLEAEPLGIRGQTIAFYNRSYSPDGDEIVSASYRYRYDANNNGFDDDNWVKLSGDLMKAQLTPTKVGKFQIELTVAEDYGKTATTAVVVDVVNLAPSVSFRIEGKNEIPEPSIGQVNISANDILNNWSLYETNSTQTLTKRPYMWSVENGRLLAGLGKGMERQYSFSKYMYHGSHSSESYRLFPMLNDDGYGPNSLSPYRALATRDASRSGPILIPRGSGSSNPFVTGEHYTKLVPAEFVSLVRSNDKYIYFDQQNSEYDPIIRDHVYETYIFALNKSRIPRVQSRHVTTSNGYSHTVELVYEWLDPNPYDFILKIPRYALYTVPYFTESDQSRDRYWKEKANNGDYSGASSTTEARTMNLVGVEISGSRIYAVYHGSRARYGYYYYDGGAQTRYGGTDPNGYYIEVRMYDALTGQYLGSSFDANSDLKKGSSDRFKGGVDLQVVGDNLVVRSRTADNHYIEFDRNGKIVAYGSLPLQSVQIQYSLKYKNIFGQIVTPPAVNYACRYSGPTKNMIWQDADGNSYSYRQVTCYENGNTNYPVSSYDLELNPDFPQGPYLVKINRNHTLGFSVKLPGTDVIKPATTPSDINIESDPLLGINPSTSKVYTRTFTVNFCNGCAYPQIIQNNSSVDLVTGAVSSFGYGLLEKIDDPNQGFHITHTGTLGGGWRTHTVSGTLDKHNNYPNRQVRYEATSITTNEYSTTSIRYGEYVGDGIFLSIYGGSYAATGQGYNQSYTTQNAWMFLDTGTASTNQTYPSFQFGQFASPNPYGNAELSFVIRMDAPSANSKMAGFSFRMTDPRNRYAVEMDGSKLYLSKYVAGSRTVLANRSVAFQAKTDYAFKVVATGNRIQVYMNNVPYFDVTDNQFSSGKYGPFSNKSYTYFSGIGVKEISGSDVNWLANYAIWEEGTAKAEVRYADLIFTDPESDPRAGSFQWSIQHTPKFLNNQGVSALHGRTFTAEVTEFDKVGVYRITLRAQDDPHPDYWYPSNVFAEYRKNSNEFWQLITVHRRPIAQFTLSVDPSTKNVVWNDTSYDPDRWLSPTNYSTEETGIDYRTTRGILERKYFYISPSGQRVEQKLVTPAETGTYTVGLSVKDEYGAWSHWAVRTIQIASATPPNHPPVAGFTVTPASGYRGTAFTITSTASDPEDGPAANLQHAYYIRNVTEKTPETLQSTSRGTWTKTFSSLGVMEIRQVVTDSKGATAQFVRTVTVANRKPAADFSWSPEVVREGDLVTFHNASVDPDGDPLTHEWQIRGDNGELQHSSSSLNTSFRFREPGTYTVTLRVSDGRDHDQTMRSIPVLPLALEADIAHTPEWLAHHRERGHRTEEAPKQFYAGERMLLYARHSAAPYDRITARLDTTGRDGNPLKIETDLKPSGVPGLAAGELYDERLSSLETGLPSGMHQVVFMIRYANGVEKTVSVPFEIIGHVLGAVQVHRLR